MSELLCLNDSGIGCVHARGVGHAEQYRGISTGYLVFFKPLDTLLERPLDKRIEFRFVMALQFAELDFG